MSVRSDDRYHRIAIHHGIDFSPFSSLTFWFKLTGSAWNSGTKEMCIALAAVGY